MDVSFLFGTRYQDILLFAAMDLACTCNASQRQRNAGDDGLLQSIGCNWCNPNTKLNDELDQRDYDAFLLLFPFKHDGFLKCITAPSSSFSTIFSPNDPKPSHIYIPHQQSPRALSNPNDLPFHTNHPETKAASPVRWHPLQIVLRANLSVRECCLAVFRVTLQGIFERTPEWESREFTNVGPTAQDSVVNFCGHAATRLFANIGSEMSLVWMILMAI